MKVLLFKNDYNCCMPFQSHIILHTNAHYSSVLKTIYYLQDACLPVCLHDYLKTRVFYLVLLGQIFLILTYTIRIRLNGESYNGTNLSPYILNICFSSFKLS